MRDDEPSTTRLSRRRRGIETFLVEGVMDGTPVHAAWDGRWVVASPGLLARAELVVAVETLYEEVGLQGKLDAEVFQGEAERMMRAMLIACESVATAEFSIQGHRRVIAQ